MQPSLSCNFFQQLTSRPLDPGESYSPFSGFKEETIEKDRQHSRLTVRTQTHQAFSSIHFEPTFRGGPKATCVTEFTQMDLPSFPNCIPKKSNEFANSPQQLVKVIIRRRFKKVQHGKDSCLVQAIGTELIALLGAPGKSRELKEELF